MVSPHGCLGCSRACDASSTQTNHEGLSYSALTHPALKGLSEQQDWLTPVLLAWTMALGVASPQGMGQ